jgi:hypothetical protein
MLQDAGRSLFDQIPYAAFEHARPGNKAAELRVIPWPEVPSGVLVIDAQELGEAIASHLSLLQHLFEAKGGHPLRLMGVMKDGSRQIGLPYSINRFG